MSTPPGEPRPPAAGDTIPSQTAYYDAPEPDAPLSFHVAPPDRPGALLDRLGPPPSWSRPARLRAFLERALEAAGRLALAMAPGHGGRARRRRGG